MKLTNYIRDAFINEAMNDVPKVDHSEEIRKLVVDDFVARLPPAVAKLWKDAKLRHWVKTQYATYGNTGVSIPWESEIGWRECPPLTEEVRAKVAQLADEARKDEAMRKELRTKLKAAAYGCTTRKTLVELLPEFAHYLPKEESPTSRAVPVVQNMVADFVKAGWPKNKKRKAA